MLDALPISELPGFSLRLLERSDLADWYAYLSRSEVYQHTSWNVQGLHVLEELMARYESSAPDSTCRFAVIDEKANRLAGTIGLHCVSSVNLNLRLHIDGEESLFAEEVQQKLTILLDGRCIERSLDRVVRNLDQTRIGIAASTGKLKDSKVDSRLEDEENAETPGFRFHLDSYTLEVSCGLESSRGLIHTVEGERLSCLLRKGRGKMRGVEIGLTGNIDRRDVLALIGAEQTSLSGAGRTILGSCGLSGRGLCACTLVEGEEYKKK